MKCRSEKFMGVQKYKFEEVETFSYLGVIISRNSYRTAEIEHLVTSFTLKQPSARLAGLLHPMPWGHAWRGKPGAYFLGRSRPRATFDAVGSFRRH